MRLTIERDALHQVLTRVMGATDGKADVVPVLANILLDASDDTLSVMSTNQDIQVSTFATCSVGVPGTITAPASELADIARRAPAGAEISLTCDLGGEDKRLHVKIGRTNFALPTLPADNFPVMGAMPDKSTTMVILRDELLWLIERTRTAIATDKGRPIFTGAHLHLAVGETGSMLRMAATDGLVLALAEMAAPVDSGEFTGVVLPRKTLTLMQSLLAGNEEKVTLETCEGRIRMSCGQTLMVSKVLDGIFPDCFRIIPKGQGNTSARVKGSELARGIDNAMIVSKDKAISVRFTFAGDGIVLNTRNSAGGFADAVVDGEIQGDEIKAFFSAKRVHDVASLIGTADMICDLWSPNQPIRIRDAADAGVTYVVSANKC